MKWRLRFTKGILAGISALALAAAFLFSPLLHKAEASVSWGQEVTETGKIYLGKPYKWGGTTPTGFDASGFTKYIFMNSAAKINLPASSSEQYKMGKGVKQNELKEGDLVFFNTNGKGVSFVGVFLSNKQFLAVTVNKGVSVQSLTSKYWKDKYIGAKRILPEY